MGEKKLVNRNLVIGTAILCVLLLSGLVGAVITYTSMLNAKDALIASQELQIADEAAQTSDLEALANQTQSEIDDLNSQIAEKDSTIEDLNQQLSQKNNRIASLNDQLSQKDSTTSINNQDSVIADLNEEISQKDSQIASLTNQISSLTSQIASLNSKIAQDNATIESLNDQIALLESETNSLAAEIADLHSQISNLNSQITILQNQNADLALQITILNSELADLQVEYDNYVAAYQNLRDIVNQRIDHTDISDFITPEDPAVISLVYSITGGWSNPSDPNELWTDLKTMYTWVLTDTNIDYNHDGLNPILPEDPSNELNYGGDMWQYPNETLSLGYGDCEDQAILLCSMFRCYAGYATQCVWITSSTAAHVGVQIPVSGDKLVIFDPAGEYYSNDGWGNIAFNDVSVAINDWFDYWVSMGVFSSDIRVYRVFSDYMDQTFTSTSEYLSWMYS